MNIEGWAFKPNEKELAKQCRDRYDEIKHLRESIIKTVSPQYGKTVYTGDIGDNDLSPKDIALICDSGNTCFGGTVDMSGKSFRCTIYID